MINNVDGFIDSCCLTDPRSSSKGTVSRLIYSRYVKHVSSQNALPYTVFVDVMKQRFSFGYGQWNMLKFYVGLKEGI